MRKYIARFSRTNTIFAILALLFLASLGVGNWPSGARQRAQKDELPQVKNETESFQLVSAKKTKDTLLLRMKNISDKTITAYSLALGDGSFRMGRDYCIGGDGIAPGAIEEISIPLMNLAISVLYTSQEKSVTVLAIVFDDHSSEGNFEASDTIRDDRLGQSVQLKRINRLIRTTLKSSDANLPATLKELKSRISSLPENQEPGQSSAFRSGLHFAKERALRQIEALDKGETTVVLLHKSKINGEVINNEVIKVKIRDGLTALMQEGETQISKF